MTLSTPDAEPTLTTLLDWLEGRLPDDAAAGVQERVARGDARVTAGLDWLRGFLATAAQVPLHQPPPLVRQSLHRHFASWQQARVAAHQVRLRITGSLLFDSRRDLPLAGVRAGGAPGVEESAHLAYASDHADLVLDLTETGPGRVRIDGQVLPLDGAALTAFEAVVEGPSFRLRTVDGDEEGRFCLRDVPVSAQALTVANADLELRVPLDVRGPT